MFWQGKRTQEIVFGKLRPEKRLGTMTKNSAAGTTVDYPLFSGSRDAFGVGGPLPWCGLVPDWGLIVLGGLGLCCTFTSVHITNQLHRH
jgi:hypothetical protein